MDRVGPGGPFPDGCLEGTLLEQSSISKDLLPQIYAYWHLLRIKDRPALKETPYTSQYQIGSRPDLNHPYGLALDKNGDLFIADTNNQTITVYSKSTGEGDAPYVLNKSQQIGEKGPNEGQFCDPVFVAFDFEENMIVADSKNNRVQVFDKHGKFKLAFGEEGEGPGQLQGPLGLDLDHQGNIVVVDSLNNRLQIFASSGAWIKSFGSKGQEFGELSEPTGVAVDFNANFIVTDWGNHRIAIFNAACDPVRVIGSRGTEIWEFDCPWGLYIDRNGKIIVADGSNWRLQVFSPEWEFLMELPIRRKDSQELKGKRIDPMNPVLDAQGNLLLVDCTGNRVLIYG